MAEVKWIKMDLDIFDNKKIRIIETLPDGDTLLIIWLKLLCLAGSVNDCGLIYITREIPFTDQMLASYMARPLATVQAALQVFQRFEMIEIIDNIIHISNWEAHQSLDAYNRKLEYDRQYRARERAEKKALAIESGESRTTNRLMSDDDRLIEEEIEEEEEIDLSKDKESKKPQKHKHGRYANVLLTDDELATWRAECPEADKYIENLSEYMASKGKSYKSHLATLRSWYRKDKANKPSEEVKPQPSYDTKKWYEDDLGDIKYERRKKHE